MDYAWSTRTESDEWASDLDDRIRNGEDRASFGPHICHCGKPAIMVAIGANPRDPRGRYQLHPHFRSDAGVSHEKDCAAGQTEKLVRNGELLPAETAFPSRATYPARFVRPVERERVDNNADLPERSNTKNHPSTSVPSRPNPDNKPRRSHVATIKPICAHYIHYRHQLQDRTLELPPLYPEQQTANVPYASAFKQLNTNGLLGSGEQPHAIVYGPLLWKSEPDYTSPRKLVITLNAGDWDSEHGHLSHTHRIIIDWSMWSEDRRKSVADNMRKHYTDAKDAWSESKTDATNIRGKLETWVFAFGRRINDTDFVVDAYSDYCIVNARLRGNRTQSPRSTRTLPTKRPKRPRKSR